MLNAQCLMLNEYRSKAGSQIGGFSDENKHLSTKIYQYIYINVYIYYNIYVNIYIIIINYY